MTKLIVQTRDALLKAGTFPKKSLSQNFLINEELLEKQISHAQINKEDIVLEIGGGTGILTERLATRAKKVYSVEYDSKLAKYLQSKFKSQRNVTIIEGDALKIDLPQATKIVANLPYHISSPLTFKLLDIDFKIAILMYQYEFALRMIAKPNSDDYSRLSVNLQYQAEVAIMTRVPRNYFFPMPKIDSAIVKITLKREELPVPINYYRNVSRILFNTKNKLISSVLYDFYKKIIPKEDRMRFRMLINTTIRDSDLRVRQLTVDNMVRVTQDVVALVEAENLLETIS